MARGIFLPLDAAAEALGPQVRALLASAMFALTFFSEPKRATRVQAPGSQGQWVSERKVASHQNAVKAARGAANGAALHGSADSLREQAQRCRRLSNSALDRRTLDSLEAMASEYEAEAARLDGTS